MSTPSLALSIRQPYVEQILRGIKTVEYRSRPTGILGQRFYLYAARTPGPIEEFDLIDARPGDLPVGLLVATAVISHCSPPSPDSARPTKYRWHLAEVRRLAKPLRPQCHPQPVWFRPFVQRAAALMTAGAGGRR